SPRFIGDVDAQSVLKVNRKGGSITATLKKAITDHLNLSDDHLVAAVVDLGLDRTILLLGADPLPGDLQVIRRGGNSVEIVADDDGDVEVDPITEAFLALKA